MNDTALRLADALEQQFPIGTAQHYLDGEAAVELRRLHQSEREGWRWADELEQERKRLHAENEALREANEAFAKRQEWWNDKMVRLEALNAELVEALEHAAECVQTNYLPDKCGHDWDEVIAKCEVIK